MKRVCTATRIWKTSKAFALSPFPACFLKGSRCSHPLFFLGRGRVRSKARAMLYTLLNPYELAAIIRRNKHYSNQSLPRRV
ncbi:hypothetical protein FY044_19315 [Leclercia adecarboxylata]|nr:hypothetical protein FR819_19845 [Leclercia adecarboxylata]QFH66574.1 hypothetical protein FR773_18530 [Leclercia adecarboxylata]QIG30261.1 hypothetical protein FY044_19315 [Leclercia adecarboxylata]